jgi:hypothetical protein
LSICDLIFHSRLPPLERSSANILITQQLEHTTIENVSQLPYIENNQAENEKDDNKNTIGLDQQLQKNLDIISAKTSSFLTEQSSVSKLDINVGKNIFVESSNMFAEDNTPKPDVNDKSNIPVDNQINIQANMYFILFSFIS